MYAHLTSITKGSWKTGSRQRGPKITFKELLSSRMTSDINSKVIGQPGQETDEIGRLSVPGSGDSQKLNCQARNYD